MFETLSVALIGLVSLTFLAAAIVRWPALALILLGANIIFVRELSPVSFSVGGIALGLSDASSIAVLIAAVFTLSSKNRVKVKSAAAIVVPLVLLVGLLVISLLRGVAENNVGAAFNEARAWVYIVCYAVWLLSLRGRPELALRLMDNFSAILIVGLALIALYHVARFGFGSAAESLTLADGTQTDGRPLSSGQSLAITLAGFFALNAATRARARLNVFLAIVGFIVCILAQNRSAWLALAVGLLFYFLRSGAANRARLIAIGLVAGLVITLAAVAGALGDIAGQLEDSAQSTGTYDARVQGWFALLDGSVQAGLSQVLFGFPFGQGWGRIQSGVYVEFSPHNWYLTVYLRVGVIGVSLLIIALLASLIRAGRSSAGSTAIGTITACLVYCWTYSLDWYVVVFLAYAMFYRFTVGRAPDDPSVIDSERAETPVPSALRS